MATFNFSSCSSQGPAPFFNDNIASSHFYTQEDLMDPHNSWMDNIDPMLRTPSSDMTQSLQNRQPLDRFMDEPQKTFFTALPFLASQGFPHGISLPSAPISTLPQVATARMASPALSHDLTSSSSSSARSPGADHDWFQDASHYSPPSHDNEFALPNAASQLNQRFSDLWTGQIPQQTFPQLTNFDCVNLSQVQGFPDAQEVMFDADEGYMDMNATIQVNNQTMKSEGEHQSYRYPSDEGLGASIKDEGSPYESSVHIDNDVGSDVDADGDADDMPQDPPSDTEYTPKSTRTRKRRPSRTITPPANKRGRVTKPAPKVKGSAICKSCDHAAFKDAATLQRHIASSHTRAYVCVFGFAECPSTFASKNEWKRHVSSQHLNLTSWVCELGACGKMQGQGAVRGSEFNRKDLFTQHLRRMHAPFDVKRMNKKNTDWEERLKELQVSCLRVKRQPPARLACPLDICNSVFEGISCWDERMEHVGKHLEKAGTSSGKDKMVIRQVDDELLVTWALREHIIERRGSGYRLCGVGGSGNKDNGDEDAECEEE